MNLHELLYRLYQDGEADALRQYQDFVDLFPPVDSRVALAHWEDASDELTRRKQRLRDAYEEGDILADVAARATREQAFTALDLYGKYDRAVNVLVLDVDETLRSAGSTDNEIPRETLHLLTELHEDGMPIVICTGQTLENVKGFTIQGLGSELVHSGDLAIVYEAGTGVFTPGHGSETKKLLFADLDADIQRVFDSVRSRVLADAPESIRRGCHLQGNEFNVTLKPNYETGSEEARTVIDEGLVHIMDLLGSAAGIEVAGDEETASGLVDSERAGAYARAYFGAADPEIEMVLEREDATPSIGADEVPAEIESVFERLDVGYYEADAAEMSSLELNKVVGVEAAFEVLGVDDPFALVMGDSKSDLRVMKWVDDRGLGIGAAPEHSSRDVLDHVLRTDELVFDEGDAGEMLRTVYAMDRVATLNGD